MASAGFRRLLLGRRPTAVQRLRFYSSTSDPPQPPRFTNTTASFNWSDEESSPSPPPSPKSTLPPPYDPFNKPKPQSKPRTDPSNLQEIFHSMRTDGLTDHAVKMFDALSKDGLTHEALALFSHIKDTSSMPDVVAHTSVVEAYANAGGHSKQAIKTFDRMLASGVQPNAYTYTVLIVGLAKDEKAAEAGRYVVEMMGKGMRPNVKTYTAVFEAFLKAEREEEAKKVLEEMREMGFVPDEKAVREQLGRRGQVFRSLMSLLFGK